MKLIIYNTHMEVSPYTQEDLPYVEKNFTALDRFTQKEYACAYTILNGTLYLPKGTQLTSRFKSEFNSISVITEIDPFEKMSEEFKALYPPRNELQEKSIQFLCSGDNPQLGLNLVTGFGKTFCVASAVTRLNEKAIIITPNEALKLQWIKTFSEMFDYKPKNLINISGSNIMTEIVEGSVKETDVYFVNHQTLRSYMSNYGCFALHEFFKKIKVGIKVYDESHMEFANILLIDFFTNTKTTFYLTATFDRSDKSESACFKKAFKSVKTFGEYESAEATEKHVVYHVVNINSRASYKEKLKITGWQGMTAASYAKYAFFTDKNETTYRTIKLIVEKMKETEGKILIFVGLIDAVNLVGQKLKEDFPDKSVGILHSQVSKDEKESAVKKDIIVSTVKSCGTGKDIKGLRTVICAEELASKITAKQIIGRLRPFGEGKETYYFDIVNICIPSVTYWFRARFKTLSQLVKKIVYLDMDK